MPYCGGGGRAGWESLSGLFIRESVLHGSTVYTDKLKSCENLGGSEHESVNHKAKGYVRRKLHTNGIESARANVKRTYMSTYHRWSQKHEHSYLA